MLPDRVSNPGPLTYEPGALPIALRGPATINENWTFITSVCIKQYFLNNFYIHIKHDGVTQQLTVSVMLLCIK